MTLQDVLAVFAAFLAVARFYVRVDQRVVNLERQIFGDRMTELLRSGAGFVDGEDDTIPL